MSATDREQAIALATERLVDLGRNPARYDVEVAETHAEWQVTFVGKHPRPPGDEVFIYVDKGSGELRIMLGE